MSPDRFDIAGPSMPFAVQFRRWQKAGIDQMAGLVLSPEVDPVPAAASHPECSGAGLYALFSADLGLNYIGKARDLAARVYQHHVAARYGREPRYAFYVCMWVPEHAMGDVEIAHIHALQPPQNVLYETPRWPGHRAMVALIQAEWGPPSELLQ